MCFGGTENHLLLIDLTNKNVTGHQAEVALDKAAITVNKNTIPDDPRSPMDPSGIRLGTPAVTTRGMGEEEMTKIAKWMDRAIVGWENEAELEKIREEVKELTSKFPLYPGLKY